MAKIQGNQNAGSDYERHIFDEAIYDMKLVKVIGFMRKGSAEYPDEKPAAHSAVCAAGAARRLQSPPPPQGPPMILGLSVIVLALVLAYAVEKSRDLHTQQEGA